MRGRRVRFQKSTRVEIDLVTHELHPRRAFRIARPRREPVLNVFVRVTADGFAGWGEASPNAFYGETADGVAARLSAARTFLRTIQLHSVEDLSRLWETVWPVLAPSRAAQCALDLALWDWLAQRREVTVAELAWGKGPRPVRTFCTIGLSTESELEEKIAELKDFPLIKIKSDERADLAPVRYAREKSKAILAVDANCAWGGKDFAALSTALTALGVQFLEQPFPPGENPPPTRSLPIIADESCVVAEDVERVAQQFDGFNIKLVKCGGLTPALRMARRGRELGAKTMVGCMLESSVLIAAGAVVAQQTDYADLDGAWLIRDDPFDGWNFQRGVLSPPARAGLGVHPHQ
jgi:L-alanine-DL-glutamate epimerase-like enolase superfamily enzyme